MTQDTQSTTEPSADPNYCAAVAPIYRDAARHALSDLHYLSAALHEALGADPLNFPAIIALGNSFDLAIQQFGGAIAGMGAAYSCKGVA